MLTHFLTCRFLCCFHNFRPFLPPSQVILDGKNSDMRNSSISIDNSDSCVSKLGLVRGREMSTIRMRRKYHRFLTLVLGFSSYDHTFLPRIMDGNSFITSISDLIFVSFASPRRRPCSYILDAFRLYWSDFYYTFSAPFVLKTAGRWTE